jgi:hypothetical protein
VLKAHYPRFVVRTRGGCTSRLVLALRRAPAPPLIRVLGGLGPTSLTARVREFPAEATDI